MISRPLKRINGAVHLRRTKSASQPRLRVRYNHDQELLLDVDVDVSTLARRTNLTMNALSPHRACGRVEDWPDASMRIQRRGYTPVPPARNGNSRALTAGSSRATRPCVQLHAVRCTPQMRHHRPAKCEMSNVEVLTVGRCFEASVSTLH